MTWVKTFAENETTGRVAEVYEEVMNPPLGAGRVPIVINSMGLRPEALLSVWR